MTAVNTLSTSLVTANLVSTFALEANTIFPFTLSTNFGYTDNKVGPYSILRNDTIASTIYNQVSSITQNILQSQLNIALNDQTTIPAVPVISISPGNVEQWASTAIILDNYNVFGGIQIADLAQWSSPSAYVTSGTFDFIMNATDPRGLQSYRVVQDKTPGIFYSTFVQGQPRPQGYSNSWRFTLPANSNGGWTAVSPAPPPYQTVNSNAISIWQDINDTYIEGTDRLHLKAGDIFLDGVTNLGQVNTLTADVIQTSNLISCNASINAAKFSTINTGTTFVSSMTYNPAYGTINALTYKSTISWNDPPTTITPFQSVFTNVTPDFLPQYNLIPAFIGRNYFNSFNVSQWNGAVYLNNVSASLNSDPLIYVGELQQDASPYSGFFYVNNTIVSPGYALTVFAIQTDSIPSIVGVIAGNTYARVQTTNGSTWTITTVPNPQGLGGVTYNNNLTLQQTFNPGGGASASITATQPLSITAPTVSQTCQTFNLYADQIRVNSHAYGDLGGTGLPSFPIGIENNVYIDANIAWTYNPDGTWQSDATNVFTNITNTIYYDANSWIVQVIPSRFRTNSENICGWDVQPAIFPVSGTYGYAWGYTRYIIVSGDPGSGANNWNWYIAIPKNYCTY